MPQQPVIDGFEFASAGATQQGRMPLSGFARLRDLLASDAGEVAYEVKGLRDAQGRPSLRIGVRGTLLLRCQRCLEALRFEINEEEMLVLAATQDEIDADPIDTETPDRVLGRGMALHELIEDELILAVPGAPRHEDCSAGAPAGNGEEGLSPFAGLRSLLRDKH
jgi:uncharacterized protein